MNMAVNGTGAPENAPVEESTSDVDFDSIFSDDPPEAEKVTGVPSSDSETPAGDEDAELAAISGQPPEPVAETVAQPQQPQTQTQVDQTALRNAALKQLEETVYNLDEDTRRKLVTEPDLVFPKLAAQMHLGMMEQITQHIPTIVNNLVSQQIEGRLRADRAEREFFQSYPTLGKPEYRNVVEESLRTIRLMKPNAKGAELAKEGAALAAFKIQQMRRGQPPSAPPQPQQQRPQPQRQKPYAPAQQAGRATPPQNMSQDPQDQFWSDFDFT